MFKGRTGFMQDKSHPHAKKDIVGLVNIHVSDKVKM